MYDIRVNSFENRVYIAIRGTIDQPEAVQGYEKIVKAVNNLIPGYIVVTDVRGLEPPPADVRLIFLNTMQMFLKTEMGLEVRVVDPENPVSAQIFQRISRSIGYTAQEVHSVPEAERFIDQTLDT